MSFIIHPTKVAVPSGPRRSQMPNAKAASMAKQPNSKTDCQVETAKETTFSLFDIPGQTFLRQNSVPISLSYFSSVIHPLNCAIELMDLPW